MNTLIAKKNYIIAGLFGSLVLLGILIFTSKTANAGWYPGRDIKPYSAGVAGFDVPTFNSFSGTNTFGDERTFFEATTESDPGNYDDAKTVNPGDVVILRTYFHNGADPSKNDPNFTGPGVATNSRVKIFLPDTAGTSFKAYSYISADNARYFLNGSPVLENGKPVITVYDSADITSSVPVKLEYISGSAKMFTQAHNFSTSGVALPDSIVFSSGSVDPTVSSGGAPIGYDQANGIVPGCFEFEGWVFIKANVVAQPNPAISVVKKVKEEGTATWSDANDKASAVKVPDDATVAYLITFKNTGNVTLHNVLIRDSLPPNMTYVPGSTRLIDGSNPDPGKVMPDGVVNGGIYVPHQTPNAGGHIRFQATINPGLPVGTSTFDNVGIADSDETGYVQDHAFIQVVIAGEVIPQAIEKAKSAFNETQGVDATTVKAHPGDVIRYTLITQNSGAEDVVNFIVEDDISDILIYANVTDLGGGTLGNGTISYPAETIAAGATSIHTFKVTVKPGSEWLSGGDLVMTNVYGNQVDVPLEQPSAPQGVPGPQGGVAALPVTGPAEITLGILLGVAVLGYLARKSKKQYIEAFLSQKTVS